jgi:hypothetical protein
MFKILFKIVFRRRSLRFCLLLAIKCHFKILFAPANKKSSRVKRLPCPFNLNSCFKEFVKCSVSGINVKL